MHTNSARFLALASVVSIVSAGASRPVFAQTGTAPYAVAAPMAQYMMPGRDAEVALARSAAPRAISDGAEVLVLGPDGYATAAKGGNGFVCLVERSWAADPTDPVFWNPKVRGPICLNPPAARTYLPMVLMKAGLVLAGNTRTQIAQAVTAALHDKHLPALEAGAMSYMMSKGQYLSDDGKSWHPHLMWFVPGDAAKGWGANLPGSPVLASNAPEDGMTILLVVVGHWSDGTPAPLAAH
jgi:hypothetical protein